MKISYVVGILGTGMLLLASSCGTKADNLTIDDIKIGTKIEVTNVGEKTNVAVTEESKYPDEQIASNPDSNNIMEEEKTEGSKKKERKGSSNASSATSSEPSSKEEKAHVHEYGEWKTIIQESCYKDGERRKYCTCGDYKCETIPKKEHRYGEWQEYYAPLVNAEGKDVRYCLECSTPDYRIVPKLTSYSISVYFYDAVTGEQIPNEVVTYSVSSDNCDYEGHYAENSKYVARVDWVRDNEYKIPEEQTGIVNDNLVLSFYLYPRYCYTETEATVATVMNGGIYYCLNGKYYNLDSKIQSVTSESPWKQVISYYANGTFLGEQTVPWMSYEDFCNLSPIYLRYEN